MAETGGRRARWIVVGAVALAAAASAFDPQGVRKVVRLRAEAARMRAENARLESENAALAREARALHRDVAALERAAREELRFVRPGERVYWLGDGGAP
jgi:cell division protein FtsB